jgi:hypothetical protein
MRWHQTWKLYDLIPMKSKSILPDEGFAPRPIPLNSAQQVFQVYCKPKPAPRTSWAKHRVFAICDCGRHVPFGRMGQHYTIKCSEGR